MIVFTITRPNGDAETLKTSRTKLTAGGMYTDDIILLNQDVSPEHGVFHITKDEIVYTDNGFGTFVNDRKIVDESILISPDDSVRIGENVITYVLEQELVTLRGDIQIKKLPSINPKTIINAPVSLQHTGPVQPRFQRLASFIEQLTSVVSERPTVNYRTTAIVIAVLMVIFWPLGLVANIIAWYQGHERFSYKEEEDPDFGCIITLLYINGLIVAMVLFIIISVAVITKGM